MLAPQSAKSDDEDPPENELREFLLGVPLGNEKRKDILDTLGKEVGMKQETVDFLKLLVDTNRLEAVESIITVFETRYNELTDTQARPFLHVPPVCILSNRSQQPHIQV